MAEAIVEVFADDGFIVWGDNWDNPIDYQHFQVSRELAERLAQAPSCARRQRFLTTASIATVRIAVPPVEQRGAIVRNALCPWSKRRSARQPMARHLGTNGAPSAG